MSTETQAVSGDSEQIPDHVLSDLRRAGASALFLRVIQVQPEDAGVPRNSSREEILKYMEWCEDGGSVTDYLSYGGGFFQGLFDGHPSSPDMNNTQILAHVRQGHDQETTGVVDLV